MSASNLPPPQLPPPKPPFAPLYLAYLVIFLIPTAALLTFFLSVAPPFKEVFRDFRTTLPPITQWMFYTSDLIRDFYLWIPILLLAFILPIFPARLTRRQPYGPNRIMYILIGVILMMLFIQVATMLAAWTLLAPLIKLIQSVSGGENARG